MRANHIFWVGIVTALFVLSGCCGRESGLRQSTVEVSGVGVALVVPDMVSMTVAVSKTESTTRLAREAVGRMTARVLAILREAAIEDKDVETASLQFNPQYEWRGTRSVLVGQQVRQSVRFAVRGIASEGEKLTRLVDSLGGLDGIVLGEMEFSVEDKAPHYSHARELAFEKARAKAQQYANLAGLRLGEVLSVTEDESSHQPIYANRMLKQSSLAEFREDAAAGPLPSGQSEITARVSVVFLLK